MSLHRDDADFKSISLLNQSSLRVVHGGVTLQLQGRLRHNVLRFVFLVDAASCKRSPQTLFSMAVGRNDNLFATVQSCSYPSARESVKLTLRLCDQSFSTNIACGSWIAASLSIADTTSHCPTCASGISLAPSAAAACALRVTIADSSFIVSNDFPQRHFREALHLGALSAETAQPALFRDIVAEFMPCTCAQCLPSHFALPSCTVEPGFLAPLQLRCNPLDVEGMRKCVDVPLCSGILTPY